MLSFNNIIMLRGIRTCDLMDDVTFDTKGMKGILNKFENIIGVKDLGGSRMLNDDFNY